MGDKTTIEWTATHNDDGTITPGATWNPIRARNKETGQVGHFCEKISPGCGHCYASTWQHRLGTHLDFLPANRDRVEIFLDEKTLMQPLRWQRGRKIFVCSMSDLFGEWVPDAWIDRIFSVMAAAPHHTFQVLTKRAERMPAYFSDIAYRTEMIGFEAEYVTGYCRYLDEGKPRWPLPLPNVWLGVSVEDQKTADERIPLLLKTPAAVRWISAEPLLGPVNLHQWICIYANPEHPEHRYGNVCGPSHMLDWVVVGGESGPRARPMHPAWARDLRNQCEDAGVAYLFKQWGEYEYWEEYGDGARRASDNSIVDPKMKVHLRDVSPVRFDPETPAHRNAISYRVGKKAAGRLLDGRTWDEFPHTETV